MQVVYIGLHLVLAYVERLFSTVCYFFGIFACQLIQVFVSLNYIFNVFLTCLNIEVLFIFGSF